MSAATVFSRDIAAEGESRKAVYYWKCDRPEQFRAATRTAPRLTPCAELLGTLLRPVLGEGVIRPGGGQGNHHTFLFDGAAGKYFLRVEDGPDHDRHFLIEEVLLPRISAAGVPVPRIVFTDANRTRVPFAVQAVDYLEGNDLNVHLKAGRLETNAVAGAIGRAVGRWQSLRFPGFGHFSAMAAEAGKLEGLHPEYPQFFYLQLERHMDVLTHGGFLTADERADVRETIRRAAGVLELAEGCLVHKDLALWNVMGHPDRVTAFIDWDDAVSGDATDDLSLLACFHDEAFLREAVRGYVSERPLPPEFLPRFWLHLLRNMLVKAVIRLTHGYFARTATFFLIGPDSTGAELHTVTRRKLFAAVRGLHGEGGLELL